MEYVERDPVGVGEVTELYESVGWSAYAADPVRLAEAVARSTFWVTAREHRRLVGIARCLSEDFSICYVRDVLVRLEFQGQGVGRELLDRCLRRFEHVRQRVLLTADEERQHGLYRSAGFIDVATLRNDHLHAFVSIKGVALS